MRLSPGSRLESYEILALIGVGGMGEVYRAHDNALGRDVAIKLIAPAFGADSDRLARFEREARVLASLNHPNIGAIYGLTNEGGVRGLVLELVEGSTLAERIAAGPLPLRDALKIAVQIADALDAAHQRQIVHRDLKPANIKLADNNVVKVLDFGIAKALGDENAETKTGTNAGAVLGTVRYMSPEQARGLSVDKRTDIWAFGCVLYEMLTGRFAFDGKTGTDAMVAILEREPDWSALPASTPRSIGRLLRRCLEKDGQRRLRDIGDARADIDEVLNAPAETSRDGGPVRRGGWSRRDVAWAIVTIAALFAGLAWRTIASPSGRADDLVRLSIPMTGLDPARVSRPMAISPDGRRIVIARGTQGLYLRDIGRAALTLLSGTAGAVNPLFSPDGEWVGYFSDNKLKKVSVSGGAPITLANTPTIRGFSWSSDGTIVFGDTNAPLRRVSADGEPRVVSTLDKTLGESSHRWPHVLPGGRAVLFAAGPSITDNDWNSARIVAQSLITGERKVLVERGSNPIYASGYLLYVSGRSLLAQRFDPERLEIQGPVVTVQNDVMRGANGSGWFDVSAQGTLVHCEAPPPTPRSLVWVDRSGVSQQLPVPSGFYSNLALSRDGSHVVITVSDPDSDIWVYDVNRGSATRITSDGKSMWPVWSADGSRIVFTSTRDGATNLRWKAANGTGEDELLLSNAFINRGFSWSPSGVLAHIQVDPSTGADIWGLKPGGTPTLLVRSRFTDSNPRFSPTGRWIAFNSDETARGEIYLQPYPPESGDRVQVTTEGGFDPIWSRDGHELFFTRGTELWSVQIRDGQAMPIGQKNRRLQRPGPIAQGSYDVAPDGRLLMIDGGTQTALTQIEVTINWTRALAR